MSELLHARGDVEKCIPDGACPLQESCLRNLRPCADRQVYSQFDKWMTEDCEGFAPVMGWIPT